jgi:two-component system, NarL family, invasion response regulator UvrY
VFLVSADFAEDGGFVARRGAIMKKILIADDHSVVRQGVRLIISEAVKAVMIDEAANGNEVLEKIKKTSYNLVLLDIAMDGMNGLETLTRLKEQHSILPVLVFSMYPEDQYALRVLKTGAAGYINKQSPPEELVNAVNKVLSGGKYVSASLAEQLAYYVQNKTTALPHEELSNREYQIMCMIAEGKRSRDIAEDLSLSTKTISSYRSRIMSKMKTRSNTELVRYAVEHGLIE